MRLPAGPRRLQLFCFPYAGGSASGFLPWRTGLAADVELCAVQLPGRGARLAEPPLRDLDGLLAALASVIREQARPPFAFFGHSLGALVAFELTRRLRRARLPMPERLIVSAASAPPCRGPSRRLHELDDDALLQALRDYNGSPPEALAHRELMELLLPAIRADFALLHDYRYGAEAALNLPITVLAGRRDTHVPAGSLEGWQECSTVPVRQRWFEGDHFFLHTEIHSVLTVVNAELATIGAAA